MQGTAHKLINEIIEKRANKNEIIIRTTQTKLLLKGIKWDDYTPQTPDDAKVIEKIKKIATDLGVALTQGEY